MLFTHCAIHYFIKLRARVIANNGQTHDPGSWLRAKPMVKINWIWRADVCNQRKFSIRKTAHVNKQIIPIIVNEIDFSIHWPLIHYLYTKLYRYLIVYTYYDIAYYGIFGLNKITRAKYC